MSDSIIMMVTMAKSGSGFFNKTFGIAMHLAGVTGRDTDACMAPKNVPAADLKLWERLHTIEHYQQALHTFIQKNSQQGKIFYRQSHFHPGYWPVLNENNIKIVVSLRDPRQTVLSWLKHHMQRYPHMRHAFMGEVIPAEVCNADFATQLEWYVKNETIKFAKWAEGWLELAEKYPDQILIVDFKELVVDYRKLMRKVFDFYGYTDLKVPVITTEEFGHFRSGQLSEFAKVFTPAQLEYANSVVPDRVWKAMNLEVNPDPYAYVLPSVLYPVTEAVYIQTLEAMSRKISANTKMLSTDVKIALHTASNVVAKATSDFIELLKQNPIIKQHKVFLCPLQQTAEQPWLGHLRAFHLPLLRGEFIHLFTQLIELFGDDVRFNYAISNPSTSDMLRIIIRVEVQTATGPITKGQIDLTPEQSCNTNVYTLNHALWCLREVQGIDDMKGHIYKAVVMLKTLCSWTAPIQSIQLQGELKSMMLNSSHTQYLQSKLRA